MRRRNLTRTRSCGFYALRRSWALERQFTMSKDIVKNEKAYSRDSRVGSNINSPVYSMDNAESDEDIQAGRIEG